MKKKLAKEIYKSEKGLHLGIMPDGSRRWAQKKDITNYDGGRSGEVADTIVRHVFKKYPEVSDLSIWALSTENLQRSETDKKLVYRLLIQKMKDLLDNPQIYGKNIKVKVIGSRWREIPSRIKNLAQALTTKTEDYEGATLNICIGYGGKEEILNAAIGASNWVRENPLETKLWKNIFEKFLLISKPLDIVIRTGGEKRLSGFMLYQIEYTELFFSDTLWPDFTTKELDEIMLEFSERNRRFGK
jgi:undecaprenyl diphosphate synthase